MFRTKHRSDSSESPQPNSNCLMWVPNRAYIPVARFLASNHRLTNKANTWACTGWGYTLAIPFNLFPYRAACQPPNRVPFATVMSLTNSSFPCARPYNLDSCLPCPNVLISCWGFYSCVLPFSPYFDANWSVRPWPFRAAKSRLRLPWGNFISFSQRGVTIEDLHTSIRVITLQIPLL